MKAEAQNSLASQYHDAKAARKCLTTSFKIKSSEIAKGGAIEQRPKTTTLSLQFEEPTSRPKSRPSTQSKDATAKPKLALATEYRAARKSYAESKPPTNKENISQSKVAPTITRNLTSQPHNEPAKPMPPAKDTTRRQISTTLRTTRHKESNSTFTPSQPHLPSLIEIIPPQHTSQTGYELLGVTRPKDKNQEHGLADGIKIHLIESIKLCGLRKGK
jgi:hypothetical protein